MEDEKVVSFNETHPELREGEVFITNSDTGGAKVGWKSKRVGEHAYSITGVYISNLRPIFALQSEVELGLLG